jgi:hypothetical protein
MKFARQQAVKTAARERAEALAAQYRELGSLEAVGQAQVPPISRERVRQILEKLKEKA